MPKHMERKPADTRYWKPVAILVCFAVVIGFYLADRRVDNSEVLPDTLNTDGKGKISSSGQSPSVDSLLYSVENGQLQIETVADGESAAPLSATGGSAAESTFIPSGFSEEELKLLHAGQHSDLEKMLVDLDAVVIESDDGNGTGITVRRLRVMQEQQKLELASASDAEIVILAGEDGSAALTVADLRAIHKQQEKEAEMTASLDEVVIAGSVNGMIERNWAETAALHERQRFVLDGDAGVTDNYPAPMPDAGDPYLTADEVTQLHKRQSKE